jgi:hypothetical protein
MKSVASMAVAGQRAASVAAFIGVSLSCAAAQAGEYKFKTDYYVSLAGLPIGEATLAGTFDGPKYRLDGYGTLTGLVGAVYDYRASASSAGRVVASKTQPSAFSVDATDGKKTATVRMTMNEDGIRRLKLTPPMPPYWTNHPARVKVTDADTKNTIDPMSALIVAGGISANGLDKRACDRSLPVFNGRERFDVNLEFRRIDTVTDKNVPGGQVLVCSAHYHAVAGHRTDRDEIKTAEKINVELKLAPLAGSDLLLPYRITIPTPLGTAVIQAGSMTTAGVYGTRAAALAQ